MEVVRGVADIMFSEEGITVLLFTIGFAAGLSFIDTMKRLFNREKKVDLYEKILENQPSPKRVVRGERLAVDNPITIQPFQSNIALWEPKDLEPGLYLWAREGEFLGKSENIASVTANLIDITTMDSIEPVYLPPQSYTIHVEDFEATNSKFEAALRDGTIVRFKSQYKTGGMEGEGLITAINGMYSVNTSNPLRISLEIQLVGAITMWSIDTNNTVIN